MSTYAVFGMTRPRAVELARKTVPTDPKDPNDRTKVINLSETEWESAVQAEADKIMGGTKVVQLSDKFDAPHFAFDYLRLAQKTLGINARSLHVQSHAKTGERNTKTGRELTTWKLVHESDFQDCA